MAEPLVIQFAADTSRAQSAITSLVSSIAGNMASAGVSLSGFAANANATGSAIGALQQNVQRAADVFGKDIQNISNRTSAAANAQKASLEGVVKAFTASTLQSETVKAGVTAGVAATSTAISLLLAQVPSLRNVLAAFVAFEAAKIIFDSVSASVELARKHVEEFVKISKDAERAGVSNEFFQRATLGAESYGLTVEQATQALNRFRDASDIRIGEGKGSRNTSQVSDRLQQNVLAGNITPADKRAYEAADGAEAKFRKLLDIIQKLQDTGKGLAAFDLAGKFIGPEFERQLRNGEDAVNKLKAALDSKTTTVAGIRIVGDDEIARADQLDAKAKDIANTFATALAPIQKDISNSVLDTYQAFLAVESVIARVVQIAVNLYTKITDVIGAVKGFVNQVPYIGKLLTAGNVLTFTKEYLDLLGVTGGGEAEGEGLKVKVRSPNRRRAPGGNTLPSLTSPSRGGSDSENLDAVETLINQLEKARDTAKAELENVGKTNVERERAVALAKAEAAAREDFKRGKRTDPALDDDEKSRVLAAAEAMQKYRDSTKDAEQALRQAADASRYFGDAAANAIGDAILEGKSFGDILNSLTKQLTRSALQGIFTGQGAIGGVYGIPTTALQEQAGDGDQRVSLLGRGSDLDGRGGLPGGRDADGDVLEGADAAAPSGCGRGPGPVAVPAADRAAPGLSVRELRRPGGGSERVDAGQLRAA